MIYRCIMFYLGFPDSSVVEESACSAGDPSLVPGLGRSTGEEKGYPLQYSGLEYSMDCIVHGLQRVRHDWATCTLQCFIYLLLLKYLKTDEMRDIHSFIVFQHCSSNIYLHFLLKIYFFGVLNECKDELDADICLKEFSIKECT